MKKVLQLLFATGFNVILGVLVSVFNTRSLSPELYGNVKYVNNMIAFISGFLLLGYFVSGSRLIALEKDPKTIREIKGVLVIILGLSIAVMTSIMAIMCGFHLIRHETAMASLFGIAVLICSSPLLLNYINTVAPGDNRIGMISLARFLPHLIYLAVAYAVFRLFGATPERMLFLVCGSTILVTIPIIITEKPSFHNLKRSYQRLREENRSYGMQVYFGSICGVSLGYLAGVTLGIFNDNNVEVGFFTLALSLASPMSMIPTTVGTVFFRKFASSDRIDKKVMIWTILLTIMGYVGFAILIHPVVSLLYSKDYQNVSYYAALLAIGACLNGIGDMFNRFLGAHGQGKALRNGAIACGLVLMVGSFVAVYFWGIHGAIQTRNAAFLTYCLMMVYSYCVLIRKTKRERAL